MDQELMKDEDRKKIEEIIGEMKCPKHFKCCLTGFEVLCKAKDVGSESFLECLEEDPSDCKFSIPFVNTYLCKCPLRIYIAKELKK